MYEFPLSYYRWSGAFRARCNETNVLGYLTYILYDRSGVPVLRASPARGAAVVHSESTPIYPNIEGIYVLNLCNTDAPIDNTDASINTEQLLIFYNMCCDVVFVPL